MHTIHSSSSNSNVWFFIIVVVIIIYHFYNCLNIVNACNYSCLFKQKLKHVVNRE